jgi:hypothetical protein
MENSLPVDPSGAGSGRPCGVPADHEFHGLWTRLVSRSHDASGLPSLVAALGLLALAKVAVFALTATWLIYVAARPSSATEVSVLPLLGSCALVALLGRSLLRLLARYHAWRTVMRLRQGRCVTCGALVAGAARCPACGAPAWICDGVRPATANEWAASASRRRSRRPTWSYRHQWAGSGTGRHDFDDHFD